MNVYSSLTIFLTSLLAVLSLLIFPLWAGIQAWRKGKHAVAALIYCAILIPFISVPAALIAFFAYKLYKPNLDVSPNLTSFSGCGSAFCGATDRRDDGTFVTTQWLRFFFIPLVPIQSYRVSYGGRSSNFQGVVITETKQYYIRERLKLNMSHVSKTYALIVSFLLVLFMFMTIMINGQSQTNLSPLGIGVLSTILVAYLIIGYKTLKAR